MYRKSREPRHRRYNSDHPRKRFTSMFRRPGVQILILLIVALLIFIILQSAAGNNHTGLPMDAWNLTSWIKTV